MRPSSKFKRSKTRNKDQRDNMKKSNKSLGLSIRGLDSGSGQLNTIPLRVQAETASYIPHKTNWDFTSYQPAINNKDVSNNVSIKLRMVERISQIN